MNLILTAAALARDAHRGQFRKYTGEPYIIHPARVAARVAIMEEVSEDMVAAAFMHDVLEDTEVVYKDIVIDVSKRAADLVLALTNPSKGSKLPREERKAMDRAFLAKAPVQAKVIKLLDRIDNLRDLAGAASDFRSLYARESLLLLDVIGAANEGLAMELKALIKSILGPGMKESE